MVPQSQGLWKADLRSRVVKAVYYDGHRRLLAIELQHGGIRLFKDATEEVVVELIEHHAPGVLYETTPPETFGNPLSRFSLTGAAFLRKVKSASRN